MYCPKCGSILEDGAAFCGKCGASVEEPADSAPAYRSAATSQNSADTLENQNASTPKSKNKRKKAWLFVVSILIIVITLLAVKVFVPFARYLQADTLYRSEDYHKATQRYAELGDFRESTERMRYCEKMAILKDNYDKAEQFLADGDLAHAAIYYGKAGNYHPLVSGVGGTAEKSLELWSEITVQEPLTTYRIDDIIGICTDGLISTASGVAEISDQTDAVGVTTYGNEVFILFADGTITYTYNNVGSRHSIGTNIHPYTISAVNSTLHSLSYHYGDVAVEERTDYVSMAMGDDYAVLLKSNGTVEMLKESRITSGVEDWEDMIALFPGKYNLVGLNADGEVLVAGSNEYGQYGAEEWTDITSIAVGDNYIIGLKTNGTVVAVGDNQYSSCDVDSWRGVVSIAADGYSSYGIKRDGTIEWSGDYGYSIALAEWTDIARLYVRNDFFVGLKSDGTIITSNDQVNQEVQTWDGILVPNQAGTEE